MTTSTIKSAQILLVEDNEGDIILTKEAFEESGAVVDISVARNGQEALDFLYKRGASAKVDRPDLILLDINIPVYNGHEVLKEIKNDSNLKSIPVIMLTTSNNQKDINLAYKNHCNSYVKKPLDLSDFLQVILTIEQFWLQVSLPAKLQN